MKKYCIFVLVFMSTHITYSEESVFKKKIQKIVFALKTKAKNVVAKSKNKTSQPQQSTLIPRKKEFVRAFIQQDCFLCKKLLPLEWPQKISLCRDAESGVSHEYCSACLADYTVNYLTKSRSCNAECPQCLTALSVGASWKIIETANVAYGAKTITKECLDDTATLLDRLESERDYYKDQIRALKQENNALRKKTSDSPKKVVQQKLTAQEHLIFASPFPSGTIRLMERPNIRHK
jgi:hypothetical protein